MFPTLSKEENNKRVATYYKWGRSQYNLFWSTPETLAFHMGFWGKNVHSFADAILYENKFLSERANISKGDLVLDAGCGVGGSAIWIAKNIGAQVIGIANEEGLIEEARRNAIKNQVQNKVTFELQNYNHTDFPDNKFDVVWAIESFDYAPDKKELFEEVWRILKPGGRLIVADFFQSRKIKNRAEKKIFNNITTTLAVYQTQWWGEYIPIFKEVGFKNIKEFDKTESVLPSSRRLYKLGITTSPLMFALYPFGSLSKWIATLLDHWRCSLVMDKAFRLELIKYGVYYAEKE